MKFVFIALLFVLGQVMSESVSRDVAFSDEADTISALNDITSDAEGSDIENTYENVNDLSADRRFWPLIGGAVALYNLLKG